MNARRITKPRGTDSLLSQEQFLETLRIRFADHRERHSRLKWADVLAKLEAYPQKLRCLSEMERTGGEPDVVGYEKKTGTYVFFDCSPESPEGRRGLCYDRQGLESRKDHRPQNTAVDLAAEMGIGILSEAEYRQLQQLGEFDLRTSSWVATPVEIRELGGALFCDRRYGQVFVYHNGAQSWYGSRGFRGVVRV